MREERRGHSWQAFVDAVGMDRYDISPQTADCPFLGVNGPGWCLKINACVNAGNIGRRWLFLFNGRGGQAMGSQPTVD
jgi:hypothetical protein